MKVLVIGGGGREHAVCKKLSESKDVTQILCAPGNAGIAQVARCIPEVKATDVEGIVALAKKEKADFVCVTPDDPWHWAAWIVWRRKAFRRLVLRHTRRRWRQAKSFPKI